MIKNERQYRISKKQVDKFVTALAEMATLTNSELVNLETAALQSQLADLQKELQEYDALKAGHRRIIEVDSFDELPQALVQARIAIGMSQKELADRLGVNEQQVQRYEATNFQSASLHRIRQIVDALGITVRKEVFLPSSQATIPALVERISSAGVSRELLVSRILPPSIAEGVASSTKDYSDADVCQFVSTIERVFGWNSDELLSSNVLRLPTAAAGIARFKLPTGAEAKRVSAYTVYAHYLSLLVLQATPSLMPREVPDQADEFRIQLIAKYGVLNFQTVLSFAWDLGVPVIPLNDSGAFHGAFWRIGGRNVVVLKQKTMSLARWGNDCLHELFHAAQEPGEQERSVIEESETSSGRRDSEEEQQATVFAGDVSLDGRAEELAEMCVHAAGGRVERLKNAVVMVAGNEGVDVGSLANYMAFRLSLQDINWWGTATNLQEGEELPWRIARDFLIDKLEFDRLCEADRRILMQAFSN